MAWALISTSAIIRIGGMEHEVLYALFAAD
jgi:hypothetical protein